MTNVRYGISPNLDYGVPNLNYYRHLNFSQSKHRQTHSSTLYQTTRRGRGRRGRQGALNAAVAREITREMDQLTFTPPISALASGGALALEGAERERGRLPFPVGGDGNQQLFVGGDQHHLLPPSAPFAKRATSPHPFAELNSGMGLGGGGFQSIQTPAQSYVQLYQAQLQQLQQYTP
jgi:hypothetical protein